MSYFLLFKIGWRPRYFEDERSSIILRDWQEICFVELTVYFEFLYEFIVFYDFINDVAEESIDF